MASYTVTITSEATGQARATVKLDIDHGIARVTEFIVRPPGGAPIPDGQFSAGDFELLLRAVHPAMLAVDAMEAAGGDAGGTTDTVRRKRQAASAAPAAISVEPAAPSAPPSVVDAAPARASSKAAKPAVTTPNARVYRRMPDDLAEKFAEIRSVTRLAAHYHVPRHTAQGWVNRLRQQSQVT